MLSSLFGKKTTACPYCYESVNINKVAFRCSGFGRPGLPNCQPQVDPRLSDVMSDSTPVMPAITVKGPDGTPKTDQAGLAIDVLGKDKAECADCGSVSAIRICPNCHSLLPYGLDNTSPLFGLVGVRGSGKTVLLSVLHKELVQRVGRRFQASIDSPGGESGLARDLALYEARMNDQGVLPAQTAATGAQKKAPAVYEWKYNKGGKIASTIFSFYDSAGEDVSQQGNVIQQRYLGQAEGLVLLLDPFGFEENKQRAKDLGADTANADTPEAALDGITYLLRTTQGVKNNKKIKTPLAVVVPKIDAFFDEIPATHPLRAQGDEPGYFSEEDSQNIHDHVAALITDWGGDGLLRKLETNYENFRLFGVSALGAEPDYTTGKVNKRGLLPHRVSDPILWLMADRGFIPNKAN